MRLIPYLRGDAGYGRELCCVLGSRERDSVIREIERSYHGRRKRK